MPKVFLVKDTGKDFSGLSQFGEVVKVYGERTSHFRVDEVQRLAETAARLGSPDDFVVPYGPGIMVAFFVHEWLRVHGRAQFLLFHGATNRYIERRCKLEAVSGSTEADGRDQCPSIQAVWNSS